MEPKDSGEAYHGGCTAPSESTQPCTAGVSALLKVFQHFLDFGELDRLREYAVESRLKCATLLIRIAIAGNGNQLHARERRVGAQFLCDIKTIFFTGKPQIAEHQIGHYSSRTGYSGFRIEGHFGFTAHDFQEIAKQACQVLIILDHQNAQLKGR
jgi:hypothetical protein